MVESSKIRCVDRLLPSEIARPQRTARGAGGVRAARAVVPIAKVWPNGTTLHVKFLEGTESERRIAQDEALWWMDQAKANIRLLFDGSDTAEIRITFDPRDGAWSYLGTDNLSIPRDQPTMNLGFLTSGTAGHEFGHAIGLAHEHQNPAGGIQWNEPEVLRALAGGPNFWTEDEIRHNVLQKYSVDQIKGTDFDRDSIMLYEFPAAWTLDGYSTHANAVLSEADRAFIGGVIYPRGDTPQVDRLEIDGAPKNAAIGSIGEEDLYSFDVVAAGRFAVATEGGTDLVMKVYGPDDQLRLIGADDDGGAGFNPRIAADLIPGRYFVQIRHYDDAGVGEYSIDIRTA